MFAFFTATTPEGVAMMTDISQYLDFVLKMFFAFGIAFEVPIVTIVLTITGATNAQKLAEKRPYVIVGSFVVGMLLTPPDIVSQTLLAIPVWLLFELGIVFSRIIGSRKAQKEAEEANNSSEVEDSDESSTEDNESSTGDEEEPRYRQMTDEEMEAELDAIEREEEGP